MTVALLSSCNTSQQCFAGQHAQWAYGLGLPLVFLVCMPLPVSIAVLTLRGRRHNQLGHPWTITHWGFLYRSYHTRYCYWEAVVLLQTMVLVAINTFSVTLSPLYQAVCMTAALALMVLLLVAAHPHALPVARVVALQSLCSLFFTNVVGMSFLISDSGPVPGQVYKEVMGALLLLLHAVFVISVVRCLLQGVDWVAVRDACIALLRLRLHFRLDKVCCCACTEPAALEVKESAIPDA
jgi:hypothetical protein